jgi:two-component system response regulator FlrC
MIEIITNDRRMKDLIQLGKTVAQSKATILIQGESGTGKELVANLIHENSSRNGRPFVAINCAAIPETLLESELFGYERGAFTGAITAKSGKFELANGGTLLLDEISEMDAKLQAKLLRVIQEGEVDRIGGRRPISVDVRIIATTNRSLSQCVQSGTFREDLFYRLNVVNLTLPPLRERTGDVALISKHLVTQYALRNAKTIHDMTDEAVSLLQSHEWPGNVRELENVIERAVITAQGALLGASDLVIDRKRNRTPGADRSHGDEEKNWIPGTTLDDIERKVIIDALQYHNGNRTHTAKALGISIRTLRNKISDYRHLGIQL